MPVRAVAIGLVLIGAVASAAGGAPPASAPDRPPASPEASAPASDCAAEIAKRVQTTYDGVTDLAASFEQQTRSAAFGQAGGFDAPASGQVLFAKPGRMRWRYERPEPSEVVSNGKTLWIYDPAAREVQVLEVGEAFLSAAAIQFLLGSGRILDSFDVATADCGDSQVTLRLEPKEAATYERLELVVDAAKGRIVATRVFDLLGNVTDVRFSDLRFNQAPPASEFEFVTPAGVQELRLPGS